MAKYNVHGGHNKKVSGASKYLNEVTEDRKVKNKVISYLKAQGHTVYDCTDDAGTTQSKNLANIVAKCNAHTVTLDISIHLNAGGGTGCEVYYTSSKGKPYAKKVSAAVAKALGIKDRGAKASDTLYVLNHTKSPAILVECCFVDNKTDQKAWNAEKCAKAIVEAVTGKAVTSSGSGNSSGTSSGNKTTSTSNAPSYKVGNTYTLQSNMVVRTGAGTNYRAKKHSELTADGKKHDKDNNGCLDKGTKITCKQVKKSGSDIWIKCPSGWIAAYYKKKVYVK